MNTELFLVRKIALNRKSFSGFIIRIAIAAVALSVCTMIVATAMVNGFQKEIRKKVLSAWSHLYIRKFSLTNSLQEEPIPLAQDFYLNKNLIPEARHIQPTAHKGGLLKTNTDFEGIVLKGLSDDFDVSNFASYIRKGDFPAYAGALDERDIIISRILANRLKLDTGQRVTVSFIGNNIRNRPFRVRAIYETGLEEFDRYFAFVKLNVIQQLNGWGQDTVGEFEVFLKEENLFKPRWKSYLLIIARPFLNDDAVEALARDPLDDIRLRIDARLSNPTLELQTIKAKVPGIFDWLELQSMNEFIILLLMIIVAAINMITALLILIMERTHTIGILKALGSTDFSIRKLFLYYSAIITGVGLLIGNVIGIGLCLLQKHFQLIRLPQDSYYLSYAPVELNYAWIALLNIATIIITLLILLGPTAIITRITPVKAIRFD
ncbi:MAG: ABC transporter permease [Chitinophagales bacterium]|nr:ABC transporter permease [Chitinophagales bacterium]MDW8418144.1 FtsX-like permease family protein [Chitinophagales bacterium]